MKPTIKLEGFREMDAALNEFTKATARNILKRTALAAIQPMADDMKRRAPTQRGGDEQLKKSITASDKLGKRQSRQTQKMTTVEVYAGPAGSDGKGAPPQAHMQEFGTEHHGPQPFARPAWDAGKDALLDRTRDGLAEAIEKARQRAARKALKAKR